MNLENFSQDNSSQQTPEKNMEAMEKLQALIKKCIESGMNPFLYAHEQDIDLSDEDITEAIGEYKCKTDEEYKIISKLSERSADCCTRDCGTNFCTVHRMRNALHHLKSFDDKMSVLHDLQADPTMVPTKRLNAFTNGIKDLVEVSNDKKQLEELLNEVEKIKSINITTQQRRAFQTYVQMAGFNSIEDFLENEAEILKKIIKGKINTV